MTWTEIVLGVLALVGALSAALIRLLPQKGSIEHLRLDQYQEDLKSLQEKYDRMSERLDEAFRDIHMLRERDLMWQAHVNHLKNGAERGDYPPWPDLPAGLS